MALSTFVEYVLDLLGSIGPVRARAMMGGYSISSGALPVALVWEDRLYLKTDAETQPSFESAGGEPFTYELRGRIVQMSYWTPPDDALESPDAMSEWAQRALEAAARARRAPRAARAQRALRARTRRKPITATASPTSSPKESAKGSTRRSSSRNESAKGSATKSASASAKESARPSAKASRTPHRAGRRRPRRR